jgi:hypothetical protein
MCYRALFKGARMPCTLFRCLTIVAAFLAPAAAAADVSEDVPVSATTAGQARALGLDPAGDRARFLAEFTRLLHSRPFDRATRVPAWADPPASGSASGAAILVPVPLSAAIWTRAVFARPVAREGLVEAIAADRGASLLAHGLTALDDETLAFLERETAILSILYKASPAAFAAFGASLRIRDGRVVPPGGADAAPLWEALVAQSLDRPALFVPALFALHGGRIAYLYDLVGRLDAPRTAFVIGSWMPDATLRQARFAALASVAMRAYGEWRLEALPFSKPLYDLAFLLLRVQVAPSGAPLEPASQVFWSEALATDDPLAPVPDEVLTPGVPIDAAWLAETASFHHAYTRGERLDQFAFGQRVFRGVEPSALGDALVAVRSFRRLRMLMLTIERMGITDPEVFSSAARSLGPFPVRDVNRAFWSLAQLQGALALVARMTIAGTFDRSVGRDLLLSLCSLPVGADGRYAGALAEWLDRHLIPKLPGGDHVEGRVIAGLAGSPGSGEARIEWEGQLYRLDLAAAESHRLEIVRARQGSHTLDLALALHGIVRALNAPQAGAEHARAASAALFALSQEHAATLGRPTPDVLVEGIRPPPRADEGVRRAVGELTAAAGARDARRIPRAVAPLVDLVDVVLGEALLSFAYALDIGDPEGTALLARNVALRHNFGLASRDGPGRLRAAWGMPRQEARPGVAWHVTGSLLGLDVALAPMSLRRLNADPVSEAPRLSAIERETFSVGVALMNPRRLHDQDLNAIASAIARGRERVEALTEGDVEAVAAALALDGRRRRVIRWTLQHDRAAVPSMFSLAELLRLGGGAPGADLDAWGVAALASSSCPCTHFVPPSEWPLFDGRPQLGLMASAMSDLNLHVAVTLHDLSVPAGLAQPVLEAAVQEFIESVAPTDPNDWWTLARSAQAVPRERIEDYIATTAAVGGALVPDGGEQELDEP